MLIYEWFLCNVVYIISITHRVPIELQTVLQDLLTVKMVTMLCIDYLEVIEQLKFLPYIVHIQH